MSDYRIAGAVVEDRADGEPPHVLAVLHYAGSEPGAFPAVLQVGSGEHGASALANGQDAIPLTADQCRTIIRALQVATGERAPDPAPHAPRIPRTGEGAA